jgi:hypothetical protein
MKAACSAWNRSSQASRSARCREQTATPRHSLSQQRQQRLLTSRHLSRPPPTRVSTRALLVSIAFRTRTSKPSGSSATSTRATSYLRADTDGQVLGRFASVMVGSRLPRLVAPRVRIHSSPRCQLDAALRARPDVRGVTAIAQPVCAQPIRVIHPTGHSNPANTRAFEFNVRIAPIASLTASTL